MLPPIIGAPDPDAGVETAPDGARAWPLARLGALSLARFSFPGGFTGRAVRHRTVDEVWFVVSGHAELWRRADTDSSGQIDNLTPGCSVGIPAHTAFQVRVHAAETLVVLGATAPAWPGDEECEIVSGWWVCS